MNRVLLAVVLVASFGLAAAQSTYAGVSLGVTTSFVAPRLTLAGHFGVANAIADRLDVRGDLVVNVATTVFEFGVNALFVGAGAPVSPYGGAGPRLLVVTDGGSPSLGLGGIGGVEVAPSPPVALFLEGRVNGYLFGEVFFGAATGVKFRL